MSVIVARHVRKIVFQNHKLTGQDRYRIISLFGIGTLTTNIPVFTKIVLIFILRMHTITNNASTVASDHIFSLFSLTIVFSNYKTSNYMKITVKKCSLRILQRMFRMSHCLILWMMIKTKYIKQYQINLKKIRFTKFSLKEPFHKLSNEVF